MGGLGRAQVTRCCFAAATPGASHTHTVAVQHRAPVAESSLRDPCHGALHSDLTQHACNEVYTLAQYRARKSRKFAYHKSSSRIGQLDTRASVWQQGSQYYGARVWLGTVHGDGAEGVLLIGCLLGGR